MPSSAYPAPLSVLGLLNNLRGLPGGIGSFESIRGLLTGLKIRALMTIFRRHRIKGIDPRKISCRIVCSQIALPCTWLRWTTVYVMYA
jgi:hypothetical protein